MIASLRKSVFSGCGSTRVVRERRHLRRFRGRGCFCGRFSILWSFWIGRIRGRISFLLRCRIRWGSRSRWTRWLRGGFIATALIAGRCRRVSTRGRIGIVVVVSVVSDYPALHKLQQPSEASGSAIYGVCQMGMSRPRLVGCERGVRYVLQWDRIDEAARRSGLRVLDSRACWEVGERCGLRIWTSGSKYQKETQQARKMQDPHGLLGCLL